MAAPTSTTGTRTATALHHYRGLNYCATLPAGIISEPEAKTYPAITHAAIVGPRSSSLTNWGIATDKIVASTPIISWAKATLAKTIHGRV